MTVTEPYFDFMIWYDNDRFRICYLYVYIIIGGSSSISIITVEEIRFTLLLDMTVMTVV